MKVGMRTPSPTKMVKAKTTGRIKRAVKRSVNPVYGVKGVGYIKDPERAVKNKIYHKLTYDPLESMKQADFPDIEPSNAKPSFLMAIIGIIGISCDIYIVYKFFVYHQLHLVPVAISIICIILAFILKKYEN